MKKLLIAAVAAVSSIAAVSAADVYVSLSTGKKNVGTKEAPLKNLWHALQKAADGDTIHLAVGIYLGNGAQKIK